MRHRQTFYVSSRTLRARGLAGGPLLLIILGVLAIFIWRFAPWNRSGEHVVEESERPKPPILVEADSKPPQLPEKQLGPEVLPDAGPELVEAQPVTPPVVTVEPKAPVVAEVAPKTPPTARPESLTAVKPAPIPTPKPDVTPRPAPKVTPLREEIPEILRAIPVEPAATAPVKPNLIVLVEAEVDDRAGLGAYTPAQYALLLKEELEQVAVANLGKDAVETGGANLAFRERLGDGNDGMTALCDQADAQRLLLADLRIPSAGFSTIDSAYWPEVSFIAINCGDGRQHRRPYKRLEPNRQDRFAFQHQFMEYAQGFTVSQGYFLKP